MVKSFLPSVPDQECAAHLLGPLDADETNWRQATKEGEDDAFA